MTVVGIARQLVDGWQEIARLSDTQADRARRARDASVFCGVLLVAGVVNVAMGVLVYGPSMVTAVAVGITVLIAVALIVALRGHATGSALVLVVVMVVAPVLTIASTGQVSAWVLVAPVCALVLIVMLPLRAAPAVVVGTLGFLVILWLVVLAKGGETVDTAQLLRTQALVTTIIVTVAILGTASMVQADRRSRDQARRAGRANALARRDVLTGLFNRRAEDDLRGRVAGTGGAGELLSVAMIDIDGFKAINDRLGHGVGDTVLVEIAQLLRASSRHADILVRHGGDEFLLVMPAVSAVDAAVMCNRLRTDVEEHVWRPGLVDVDAPTVSIGVADTGERPCWEDVVALADQRLLAAKQAGRNRVVSAPGRGESVPAEGQPLLDQDAAGSRDEGLTAP